MIRTNWRKQRLERLHEPNPKKRVHNSMPSSVKAVLDGKLDEYLEKRFAEIKRG